MQYFKVFQYKTKCLCLNNYNIFLYFFKNIPDNLLYYLQNRTTFEAEYYAVNTKI